MYHDAVQKNNGLCHDALGIWVLVSLFVVLDKTRGMDGDRIAPFWVRRLVTESRALTPLIH